MDIVTLLQCRNPWLTATTIRHLRRITFALLAMTGRVTMLGISRWAGDGGSYRTVQRLFATTIPWASVLWLFCRQHLLQAEDVYLLAADEVVVTNAGKPTFGLDRFFSAVYQRPVPGLAVCSLAVVRTKERRAVPIRVDHVVRTDADKATSSANARVKPAPEPAPTRNPGRPKGRQNKSKTEVNLSPELRRIQLLVHELLRLVAGVLSLTYLVLDGHFGNRPAFPHGAAGWLAPDFPMARRCRGVRALRGSLPGTRAAPEI
jgi:hypothetical protein